MHDLVEHVGEGDDTDLIRRWRLVHQHPSLRVRAAEREATAADVLEQALGATWSTPTGAADQVVIRACLKAATAAFVQWAGSDAQRPLHEVIDDAFTSLRSI